MVDIICDREVIKINLTWATELPGELTDNSGRILWFWSTVQTVFVYVGNNPQKQKLLELNQIIQRHSTDG